MAQGTSMRLESKDLDSDLSNEKLGKGCKIEARQRKSQSPKSLEKISNITSNMRNAN